jgi:hypothetical protein
MMLFIWELFLLVLQIVNPLQLFSILALNIWLSQAHFAMMKNLQISSLKNLIKIQENLLREKKVKKDVKLLLMTCQNQIQIKYCQNQHQN